MANDESVKLESLRQPISRRVFVGEAATIAFAAGLRRPLYGLAFASGRKRMLAYVGTDTKSVDSAANGQGIYLYQMSLDTGNLSLVKLAAQTTNPSWISIHPNGQYLYTVNEVLDYNGKSGSVSAFSIDRNTGDLTFLNTVDSHGAGPTHMSIDLSGKYAFVANYFGGNIAVFPILKDGSFGTLAHLRQDEGALGSERAKSAPPGSFAISGHDTPHAHMVQAAPGNHFVLQTDLGQDRIYVYKFNSDTGELTPAATPYVLLPSGDGPRHFTFHPNGHWMYSIQEEASTVVLFDFDSESGSLKVRQTISTLPAGFTGTNFCSEIAVSGDGRFLYAANRLHNSIAVFAIQGNGVLHWAGEALTQGDYPTQFSLDPSGSFLYVCNQRSDQITVFRVDKKSGLLTFTGNFLPAGTPMCIAFLK